MNTETMELNFPTIETELPPTPKPAQSTALAEKPASEIEKTVVSIKDAAIAHLRAKEPAIIALAERYRGVALPLGTPKDLAAGKAARLELRESGRYGINRDRDETKDLLNEAKKHVETEADRLIAIVRPVEDHVHAQIEARETVLAEEKAERERVAAKRRADFEASIARIRGYVAAAKGLPSERIARGIAQVEALAFGEDWAEFASPAAAAQGETVAALRELLASTKAAEAIEAQRVENARIAAEQATERQRLADEAAELARQREEIEAKQREQDRIVEESRARFLASQKEPTLPPFGNAAQPAGPVLFGSQDSDDGAAIPAVKAGQDAQADQAEVPSSPGTPGAYASTGGEAAQFPGSSGDEDDGAHAEERVPDSASSPDDRRSTPVQIEYTDDPHAPIVVTDLRSLDLDALAEQAGAGPGQAMTVTAGENGLVHVAMDVGEAEPMHITLTPRTYDKPIHLIGEPPATLKLGDICKRLGFNITEAFVRDTLKLSILTDRRAVLILESDWPVLKEKLRAHIGGLT